MGKIDLSLIPIGAYLPRKFMSAVHISPQEAVQIHQELGSTFSLAMHYKTFKLSDEPIEYPPYALYLEMKKRNVPFEEFAAIFPGQYVNW